MTVGEVANATGREHHTVQARQNRRDHQGNPRLPRPREPSSPLRARPKPDRSRMLASAHGRAIEPDRLQAANRSLPAHVDRWTDETNLAVCRARVPASANAEYALSSAIQRRAIRSTTDGDLQVANPTPRRESIYDSEHEGTARSMIASCTSCVRAATVMPRGPHASAASGAPSFSCEIAAGSWASQTRTVPSVPALASRVPSGENATAITRLVWPSRVAVGWPLAGSQGDPLAETAAHPRGRFSSGIASCRELLDGAETAARGEPLATPTSQSGRPRRGLRPLRADVAASGHDQSLTYSRSSVPRMYAYMTPLYVVTAGAEYVTPFGIAVHPPQVEPLNPFTYTRLSVPRM